MPVEQNGFNLGQERIVAIDVRPARLHHPDLRIGKVVDSAQQKIFRRSKVSVKDRNEVALRRLQPVRECSRFKALALVAMNVSNRETFCRVMLNQASRHRLGFIRGIVQHLDIELVLRILELADRIQQPLNYKLLIEDGKLHSHTRQFLEPGRRLAGAVPAVLIIKINQHIPVHAIRRQQNKHDEIWNQQRHIESIGAIQPTKSRIEEMLVKVLRDAAGRQQSGRE